MAIHLHPVPEERDQRRPPVEVAVAAKAEAVYFVIQRANGHWSLAAKVMGVHETEAQAEAEAERLQAYHPQQHFGVAMLRSETRHVAKPIEIVRVGK